MFTHTARRVPAALALRDATDAYTYEETYRLSRRAAGALVAAGVRSGDAVLVSTDHTADGVLALLAVVAAGATPVPVEPNGPPARLARIVASAGAHLALTDELGREAPAGCGVPVLRLADAVRAEPSAAELAPSPLAYVLFTSGTTGSPKGVEVTHRNMLSLLAGADQWEDSTGEDVWACYHAFTFDVSMWEVWRPLSLGAVIHVLPRAAQLDGELALALVAEHGITSLCQTPTAAKLLARHVAGGGLPANLRRLLLAGERLEFSDLGPLSPAVASGALRIWNAYGPTETTVYATAHRLTADDIDHGLRSLIGRPLPEVGVEIREPDGRGVGELWLSGPQVARGFRGDAELTAERFVVDRRGRRAYRSGDLVRDAGDGVLEFAGRTGGYLKVRGYRVEPGEVEAALCAHPAVAEASALVTGVLPWGETIVAAVVLHNGCTLAETELRRHVANLLPTHMRPGRIVFLAALPRSGSTKLDPDVLRTRVEEALLS
ncbi:MAG TPA: amino acid adenylation domain-containing protein [Streptomyces sp.]